MIPEIPTFLPPLCPGIVGNDFLSVALSDLFVAPGPEDIAAVAAEKISPVQRSVINQISFGGKNYEKYQNPEFNARPGGRLLSDNFCFRAGQNHHAD
jgi:hypothetical protein